ncbi:MAG: hypothetical protein M3439_02760 [Chloroflexota bacterium]|nr:hypothetical protein [Chloroflexota bacterium]
MQLDPAGLEQLKERVAAEYQESTIGDLEAMIADCRRAAEASPLFWAVAIRKTGTPVHQIEVECRPRDPATTPDTIASEITRIWLEQLAYDDFEAHAIIASDHAIVLDFLTVARGPRIFATGMIVVVRGDRYQMSGV